MLHLESDIKTLHETGQESYRFLADFRNLNNLARRDEIERWDAGENEVVFDVKHAGEVKLEFVEKQPYSVLKTAGQSNGLHFNLWIQLKTDNEGKTRMKITVKGEVPAMLHGVAKDPLQKFLALLADSLCDEINQKTGV